LNQQKYIEQIPIDAVEKRILRALKTLRSLPDPEARFLKVKSAWPEFPRKYMDAYNSAETRQRFNPTPRDMSDYLTALEWLRGVPKADVKHIYWQSFDLSFRQVAHKIGRSHETARKRYRDVLIRVWGNANREYLLQEKREVRKYFDGNVRNMSDLQKKIA